jgi:tetratricopeptide (TPR) repeat protein
LARGDFVVRVLLAFLFAWATAARAACPGDAGEPLPPREKLPALEQELARLAPQCSEQPGYLAYRGAVLNALGRPAEAAALLERALLLDPNRAGAEVDYAESLAALGDTAGAAALLRDLLARPDVPPALRPRLEQRLSAAEALQRFDWLSGLRAIAESGWHRAGSVTLRLGNDSNLNSAPSRDALTLTLPGGEAVLLLSDRFRARSGAAGLLEATGQLARPVGQEGVFHLYGEARARVSPSASDTDYQQAQIVTAWSQRLDSGEALFSLAGTHLRYGGDDLYDAVRLSAGRDWSRSPCNPRLGAELEWRRYPTASELDGNFVGATTGLGCNLGLDRLTLALRLGKDFARTDRPGGDQRQQDVRIAWLRPLGKGSLVADMLYTHQRDASGFSPILENNAARRLERFSLHLEYAHPFAPGWSALASVDTTLQRSNIDLFDLSGRAFYVGVRWQSQR